MSHERENDLADQDLEDVAEELWTLAEEGRDGVEDLRAASRVQRLDAALAELVVRGLLRIREGRASLTGAGRVLAEGQVRRHRLGEVLFGTALDVKDEAAVSRTACVMEHALDAATTDSVCAFLGHPRQCPHGKAIPSGPCCQAFSRNAEPLVQPLDRLAPGQSARIVYIVPRTAARLIRLAGLGLVPGATIHFQQRTPAAVLRVGETTVALEPAVAGEIYVRVSGAA